MKSYLSLCGCWRPKLIHSVSFAHDPRSHANLCTPPLARRASGRTQCLPALAQSEFALKICDRERTNAGAERFSSRTLGSSNNTPKVCDSECMIAGAGCATWRNPAVSHTYWMNNCTVGLQPMIISIIRTQQSQPIHLQNSSAQKNHFHFKSKPI